MPPTTWEQALLEQDGVVTLRQALRGGMTPDRLRWRLTSGRWQRIHPRTYLAHNGPPTRRQLEWAGLLYAGPGAALCCETAAALDGFAGRSPMAVHVCVPVERRVRRRAGLTIHYSGFLGADDVHPARAPARTRLRRSLVDCATRAANADDARAVLAAGVQQRLVSPGALRAVLLRLGPVPRRALLLRALEDIDGGAQSLLELEFLALLRRFRVPAPASLQTPFRSGRRYLDVTWPGLTVEVDGGQHRQYGLWADDLDRQNDVTLERGRVLRFSRHAILERPHRVASQLRCALGLVDAPAS